jgi:hypothetical protein
MGRIYGGRLYLAAGSDGLKVYSQNGDWAGLNHLGTIGTGQPALDVVVRTAAGRTYAYVAAGTDGLKVIRVSATLPLTLSLVGQCPTQSQGAAVRRLALRGNYIYCAEGNRLRVINIATPSNPTPVCSLPGNNVKDVAFAGEHLYYVDSGEIPYGKNDQDVVHVYNISAPASPEHVGWLNCADDVSAVDVGNAIFLSDEAHLKVGLLQTGSLPTVAAGSEGVDISFELQSGLMTWTFSWRTEEWADPGLLRVTLRDGEAPPTGCARFGTGFTVTAGQTGVTTFVRPTIDGGYMNCISWVAGECVPGCQYTFVGESAIHDVDGAWTATGETEFTIELCIGG